ncbi:hypothetical protein BD779DRAFT_173617 [Infundibulicybe gibba]|nr:hypothetical protein BD779DRAFT_173617 [Infundibulicybe gibba]
MGPWDDVEWVDIMQHCTGLSHLAISYESLSQFVEVMDSSSRKDVFIGTGDLHLLMLENPRCYWSLHGDPRDKSRHFFQRITHLRLEDPADLNEIMHGDYVPRMTHLAVPCGLDYFAEEHPGFLRDVIEGTPVEVLVLVLSHDHLPEDKCRNVEDSVCRARDEGVTGVYAVRSLYGELEEEWDAEVRGGATIWERAVKYTQWLMDCRTQSRIELVVPAGLPHEVVRKILLRAAQSSVSSCRTLCEVSTWVRHLALPLLYRTVAIDCTMRLDKFNHSISSAVSACPPAFRPADAVRHLWVPIPSPTLESILRRCDNVTHLAIHQSEFLRFPSGAAVPGRLPEHCQRPIEAREHVGVGDLHIVVLQNRLDYHGWLSPGSEPHTSVDTHHLFARITHLRLGDPMHLYSQVPISQMPRLTHVAVSCGGTSGKALDSIMAKIAMRALKAFVLVFVHPYLDSREWRREVEDWVYKSRKEEPRIYTVAQMYSNIEMEWDAEARGGATIWERAVEHTRLLMSRYELHGI